MVSFEDTAIAFKSKSDRELKRTVLLFGAMNNNFLVEVGTWLIKFGLSFGLPIKGIIKQTLFKQFCGGETIEASEKVVQALADYNIRTVLDYSVEGEESEEGFEKTTSEILRTIERAKGDENLPFAVFKVTGIASAELLEKVQNNEKLNEEEKESFEKVKARVNRICNLAFENNVKVFIDAEESWIQDTIDQLAYQMMEKYNGERAIVYNTYQLYRWEVFTKLQKAFEVSKDKYKLGAKLVRGAYIEKERERAGEISYVCPIQRDKASTDKDYNNALDFCIDHIEHFGLCAGTHNEQSSYHLVNLIEKKKLRRDDERIYFAQLFGMSDHISYNLAYSGYNVAKYVPYGPVRAVIPYLFRRANENTSIAGQSSREYALVKKELRRRKGRP